MAYMADAPPKVIPPTHQYNNSIVNSVTSADFLQATSVCMNRQLTNLFLPVALPYGIWIKSTHTNMLSLLNLPKAARREHIFPEQESGSLRSVSQIFDQGCTVNFKADQVSFTIYKQTILTGPSENNTCP